MAFDQRNPSLDFFFYFFEVVHTQGFGWSGLANLMSCSANIILELYSYTYKDLKDDFFPFDFEDKGA